MLKEIIIKDFAIIDSLGVSLGPGLTCLTGETGAGKSILVDAVSVLLGGKAGPEFLRAGKDAVVEAAFDVSCIPAVNEILARLGLESEGDLLVRRILSQGRGRVYINGSMASLQTLQDIGELLVDLHGQHEHQSLLKVDTHTGLLDSYCSLEGLSGEYREAYDRLNTKKIRLEELVSSERERARRLDLARFQLDEIRSAGLMPEEEGQLGAERAKLMHADRLKALAVSAMDSLDGDASAVSLLAEACKAARDIAAVMPSEEDCMRLMDTAMVSAKEAYTLFREFAGSIEADPERLSEVEARLDSISRLKKKYGDTVADVLAFSDGLVRDETWLSRRGR